MQIHRPKNWSDGDSLTEALSFDDVLLVPQYSELESRKDVDLTSNLDDVIELKLPVISSPMDTLTETDMALAMHKAGGLGVIHRYNTIEEQLSLVYNVFRQDPDARVSAAIGVTGDYFERAMVLCEAGVQVLCLDVAHGHHTLVKKALDKLKNTFAESVHVMAGNVATRQAFDDLAEWGADSIRVGIGGGSICSTRLVTGHGIPTLQSILDCSKSRYDAKIIADGGIKNTGDMVKAFAAGADFVMVGSLLAGTRETPGDVLKTNEGIKYKVYRGMASRNAQKAYRGRSSTPEGISTTVPYRGGVEQILQDFHGGIASGLSYTGTNCLKDFYHKSRFVKQSSAGRNESNTHILGRY
jgi:IMP dehydrogenase